MSRIVDHTWEFDEVARIALVRGVRKYNQAHEDKPANAAWLHREDWEEIRGNGVRAELGIRYLTPNPACSERGNVMVGRVEIT